ncbi:MAG: efflux RND transporter periplasmic adaptor subunit [Eubacteriales bacterium]
MKKIKLKYIIIASIIIVGVFFSVSGIFTESIEVSTEGLTIRDISDTVEVSAVVTPDKTVSAVSLTGGRVDSVLVEVGDTVKEGEVLVELDDTNQSKSYDQAVAAYEEYTNSAAAFSGSSTSSKIAAREAIAMSQSIGAEYQDFLDAFTDSTETFSSIDQEAQELLTEVETAKAALNDMTIKSEVKGTVISVDVVEGGVAKAGVPVVTIAAEGKLSLIASVFESDAKSIKADQEALISANGKKYTGEVKKVLLISNETDTYSTSSLSNVGSVTITPPSNFSDMLGSSCDVSIIISKTQGCSTISLDSIVDGEYVYVILENNRLEKRQVTIGEKNDYYAEILSGLSADEIIVKNVSDVDENSKVVLKDD